MSRIGFATQPEQDAFAGMDSTSPVQAVKPSYVVSLKNGYPGLEGGIVKRDGYTTQLSSTWASRSITGGLEFQAASGSRKTVVFGTDGSGRFGFVSGGAVTDVLTGLDGATRPSFVQAGDLLLFFNGVDNPVVYDGTATRQYGISAPVTAPTAALAGGGSLNTNSNYIWAYTYYNSVTGAESSPSALSATTAMGANTKATLTLSAGTSTTADTIRVWRTVANGTILFLDGTAAISATSYVSTNADSLLTTQMEIDNSRLTAYGVGKFPIVAARRVFVRVARNQVRWSKIGQSGPMPESFEVRSVVSTIARDGSNDDLVGLATAGNVPIVLKERSVGMLDEIGFPLIAQATDPVLYTYVELSKSVSPLSHWAATEVYGECIFLAKDNIYGTRGQPGDLRAVADPIQTTIRALGVSSTQVTRVSATNDQKKRHVYFAVFSANSATQPDYVLVGDYRKYPNFRWSLYTPGTNTSTHPGLSVGCFITATGTDGTQDTLFGNSGSNGQLYRMNDGTTDGASGGIYFEVVTRPYDMQAPAQVKLYKDTTVYAQGNGNVYSIDMTAIYDLSGEEEGAYSLALSSGGATWDNVTWDNFTWSSNSVVPRRYSAHRKARHQQLVFRQTSAAAPVTLFSWVPTASVFQPY